MLLNLTHKFGVVKYTLQIMDKVTIITITNELQIFNLTSLKLLESVATSNQFLELFKTLRQTRNKIVHLNIENFKTQKAYHSEQSQLETKYVNLCNKFINVADSNKHFRELLNNHYLVSGKVEHLNENYANKAKYSEKDKIIKNLLKEISELKEELSYYKLQSKPISLNKVINEVNKVTEEDWLIDLDY
jgi:hypothetical protein